jgi:hypothetical protein
MWRGRPNSGHTLDDLDRTRSIIVFMLHKEEFNFLQFPKKKRLTLFRLLATILSPLRLTFFNPILALLAIFIKKIITYFFLLNEFLK